MLPAYIGCANINTGFVQTVKGEGMPSYESASIRGDLFIEYNVVLPMEVSQDARRSLYFLYLQGPI